MALLGGHNNSVTERLKIEIATNSVIYNVSSSVWMNTCIYYIQYIYVCERDTIKILNCRQNGILLSIHKEFAPMPEEKTQKVAQNCHPQEQQARKCDEPQSARGSFQAQAACDLIEMSAVRVCEGELKGLHTQSAWAQRASPEAPHPLGTALLFVGCSSSVGGNKPNNFCVSQKKISSCSHLQCGKTT